MQNEIRTRSASRPTDTDQPFVATAQPLSISFDPFLGACFAVPFGGQIGGARTIVADAIELFAVDRTVQGFRTTSASNVYSFADSDSPWHQLRFHAPPLVSEPAPIAELLMLAYAQFGQHGTPDVVLSQVARGLATEGDLDGAIEAALWSLAAGHSTGHLLVGSILLAAGQPTDAYGHLRTHAVRAPNDGLGWIVLGQACEARGDEPEARRAYLRALRVSTHHEAVVAREALDRLPARALWEEPWA